MMFIGIRNVVEILVWCWVKTECLRFGGVARLMVWVWLSWLGIGGGWFHRPSW